MNHNSEGKFLWFPPSNPSQENGKNPKFSNYHDKMSKTLHILKHECYFYFLSFIDVISCRCRSQRMPLALQCVLHWVERSELSCLRFFFFFFLLFLGDFFKSEKKMCRSPPWICCFFFFFFFFFGPLCLFLDGLGAFLLSQSALRNLKCPFWKWPCPSKSLIRALLCQLSPVTYVHFNHLTSEITDNNNKSFEV